MKQDVSAFKPKHLANQKTPIEFKPYPGVMFYFAMLDCDIALKSRLSRKQPTLYCCALYNADTYLDNKNNIKADFELHFVILMDVLFIHILAHVNAILVYVE